MTDFFIFLNQHPAVCFFFVTIGLFVYADILDPTSWANHNDPNALQPKDNNDES